MRAIIVRRKRTVPDPRFGDGWSATGSNSIIRLRFERRMPRLPKGEVVRWQLEKNKCLRSCVAY